MAIWGKIFGGVAGFVVGGPLGAVIGAAGGHWWDKQSGDTTQNTADQSFRSALFSTAVVTLAAKMAKADGRVVVEEIKVFKRVVDVPESEQAMVANIYRQAQKTAEGYEVYAAQAAEILGRGSAVLEELLWLLAEIAKADGRLHEAEMQMLRHIATLFGLSPQVFARIDALQNLADDACPYTVLGISPRDSDAAIKAHYRTLVLKYHPDRLMAEGLPEEAIKASGRKLAAMNQAYDTIKKQRGFR